VRHGKPAALCGELAGRPLTAMALIGLGYRSISMAAASVGPVKEMIRHLDVATLAAAMDRMLAAPTGRSLRTQLEDYAVVHEVPLS
jgi:phosphotransferase system, enzyme I, PtsP